VKDLLHLPACTSNGLLYCGKKDGGLGIPKIETLTISTSLKQGVTLLNNTDPAAQALLRATAFERCIEGLARSTRISWPILNFRHIDEYKKRQKKAILKEWSELPYNGKSVRSFVYIFNSIIVVIS
jgi:hypothetical protein